MYVCEYKTELLDLLIAWGKTDTLSCGKQHSSWNRHPGEEEDKTYLNHISLWFSDTIALKPYQNRAFH